MMRHIEATDICENCWAEFANHNYVPDSLDVYLCPNERVTGQGYGYGYDRSRPDNFSPDRDCCSKQEIANHERAEREYERCEANGLPFKCPEDAINWGIGSYWFTEQTTFKLFDEPDPDQMEFDFE